MDGDRRRVRRRRVRGTRSGRVAARSVVRVRARRRRVRLVGRASRRSACTRQVRLVPVSTPFVVNNQPLAAGARLSWLFVPRLEAHGLVRGDTRVGLCGAPAYHDHNWGSFRGATTSGGSGARCSRGTCPTLDGRVSADDRPRRRRARARRCTPGTGTNRSRSGATCDDHASTRIPPRPPA